MKLGKTFYPKDWKSWHNWLMKNSKTKKEIWLIYYRKSSGKPRILYNDAVNEALCFGWIDGIVKGIDEIKFAQRFTPRRKNSILSEMNKERVRRLIKEKRMKLEGLKAISHVFNYSKDKKIKLSLSKDIMSALKKNPLTWKNFNNFSEGYKKVRIGYIEDVRQYDKKMFENRLNHFIKMTAKNKKFGYVQ
jgi:uncharacterized protein YdeI (YjbR/CyaY-like superfamily)